MDTDINTMDLSERHVATQHYGGLFAWVHLPDRLDRISARVAMLAGAMVEDLNDGPELTAGLRKLLEAKDCFVRAAL